MFKRPTYYARPLILGALLLFGTALVPQNAWAQGAGISQQSPSIEVWQKVPQFINEELFAKSNSLVKAVKAQIATLANTVVTAIMGDSMAESQIAENAAQAKNTLADHNNQQAATLEANVLLQKHKEATTPNRADCVRADQAISNQQAELTQGVLISALAAGNVAALSGKPPATSSTATIDFVANLNGRYQAFNLFGANLLYGPPVENLDGTITLIDPETKKAINVKVGSEMANNDPSYSIINPAKYYIDNTTLVAKTSADTKRITNTELTMRQLLCGGAAEVANREFIEFTAAGVNKLPQDVKGTMMRGFCRSYLAKLYAMRTPTGPAGGGSKAAANLLANYKSHEMTDSVKKQVAFTVGTMGSLSAIKSLYLSVLKLNAPNFVTDAIEHPEKLGPNMLETLAVDTAISHQITEEMQFNTMLHALDMGNDQRS